MSEKRVVVILAADVAPYVSGIQRADTVTLQLVRTVDNVARSSAAASSGITRGTDEMHRGFSRSALAAALMDGNLKQVATTAAGFFAGSLFIRGSQAIVGGIRSVVNAGADMNETLTKSQFAFGPASAQLIAQADDLGRRFGVNRQVFLDNAINIGLIGKAAGLAAPEAATMGNNFAKLATDVSSFYNVPVADALDAIQSGLVGQERPLRQYGVLLNETAVANEAVRLGIASSTTELSEQQKVLARASLITEGFKDANGDLERTQGSLANRFRAISGYIHNFAIDLGTEAQPIMLEILDTAGKLSHDGLVVLEASSSKLAPAWHEIIAVGRDLGPIFAAAGRTAGPLIAAFAILAASGVGGVLLGIAHAVELVTGFLADHEQIVQALTVIYLTRWIPALLASVAGGIVSGLQAIAVALFGDEEAASVAAAGLDVFAGSEAAAATGARGLIASLGGVAGAVAGIATVGAGFELVSTLSDANRDAKSLADTLSKGLDLKTPQGLETYVRKLHEAADENRHLAESMPGIAGFASETVRLLTPLGDGAYRAQHSVAELTKREQEMAQTQNILNAHLSEASNNFGLTQEQALYLAKTYDIDLTKAGAEVTAKLGDVAFAARQSGAAMTEADEAAKKLRTDLIAQSQIQAVGTDVITSSIVERHNAVSALSRDSETATERENRYQGALLGVTAAEFRLADATRKVTDLRDTDQAREVAAAEERLEVSYSAVTRAVFGVLDATRALEDARRAQDTGRTVAEAEITLGRAYDDQAAALDDAKRAQEKLDYARQVGIPEEIASAQREYNETLRRQKETGFAAADAQVALNRAQQDSSNGTGVTKAQLDLADANRQVTGALDEQATAAKALDDLMNGGLQREMAQANLELAQAVQGVADANEAVAKALDTTSSKAGGVKDQFDLAKISLSEFMAEEEKQINATLAWDANLVKLSARAKSLGLDDSILKQFQNMGVKSAPLLEQLLQSNDTTFARMANDAGTQSALLSTNFTNALDTMFQIATGKMTTGGFDVGDALSGALAGKVTDVQGVMALFFTSMLSVMNSLLTGVGKPRLDIGAPTEEATPGQHYKPLPLAVGGVLDAHIAHSPSVLYGERETGGEAFIPRHGSPQKMKDVMATAASWYGMQVVPMAAGGVLPTLPTPPDFRAFGTALGPTSQGWAEYGYEQSLDALRRGRPGGNFPTGGAIGQGWKAITDYLTLIGLAYTVTSTTGGRHVAGSLHYQGKAVDLVGRGGSTMQQIFDALAAPGGKGGPIKGINELFYDPAGYFYDQGKFARGAIGGHTDHVHAATFDTGYGTLYPGWNLQYNGTGSAEHLMPAHMHDARSTITISSPLVQVDIHGDSYDTDGLKKIVDKAVTEGGQQLLDLIEAEARQR